MQHGAGFTATETQICTCEEEASYSVVCNPLRSVMVNQTKTAKSRKQSYPPSPGPWASPQTRLTPTMGEDGRGNLRCECCAIFTGLTAI